MYVARIATHSTLTMRNLVDHLDHLEITSPSICRITPRPQPTKGTEEEDMFREASRPAGTKPDFTSLNWWFPHSKQTFLHSTVEPTLMR
jgi:hypothetical protein